MNSIPPTGTSLEVLQNYLTANIEIEMLWIPLDEDRHPLRGLDTKGDRPVLFEDAGQIKGSGVGACLPVLRPFSTLVEPLPDGTVPIVEAAKLAIEDRWAKLFFQGGHKVESITGKAWCGTGDDEVVRLAVWGANTANSIFEIHSDWTVSCQIPGPVWAAIDYLRRHHFAVGLGPHQYVVKEAGK